MAGVAVAYGLWQYHSIDRVAVELDQVAAAEPRNFVIVGSDTRESLGKGGADDGAIFGDGTDVPPAGRRADSIVVARLDPTDASVELLSVPRDLWVSVPGAKDKQRINAAYNRGAQTLVDTLQDALGIPLHHYVEVDFAGFKELVEALGGVPMYFDRPVRDRNSGLDVARKGCVTLDGVQALAFARARHLTYSTGTRWTTDPTGDLGRITRQQVFMRHAMQKVASLGLDDVGTLRVLVGVAVNNVKIDDRLSSGDLLDLARKFSAFTPDKLVTHRLETEPYRTSGGAQVVRLDSTGSEGVLSIFRGEAAEDGGAPTAPALTPSQVTVDVLNGTATKGLARDAADRLGAGGFRIGVVDNGDPVGGTVIRHAPDAAAAAELVASRITPRPAVQEVATLPAGTVELDLGSTLGRVAPAPPGSPTTPPGAGGPRASVGGTSGAGVGSSAPTTTLPASNPEPVIGLQIGDPPPGVRCG